MLLRRWAGSAAKAYSLTPRQHQELETQLLDRWPKFLEENQADLQPLLKEYLQARIIPRSPSAKAMQSWARRAAPQLGKFRKAIEEGNEQFSALLTPAQQARFEADRTRLASEMEEFAVRIQSWGKGQFQEQDWWELTGRKPPQRHHRPNEKQPKPDPGDEFDREMDAWSRYVREYIKKHQLDPAQRAAAESILAEMKDRARTHYNARRLRIAAMEELIRHPQAGTTEAQIEAELLELYGPIDEMFRELDRRLLLIPTQAQKRQAMMPE